MRDIITTILILTIMIGCSRDDLSLSTRVNNQELFHINIDTSTRSSDEETTPSPTRYIMELYLLEDGTTELSGDPTQRYESENGSFFVTLDEGDEYAALFWADFESIDNTDHIYNADDLKCVVIEGQPSSEAFSGYVYFKYESMNSEKPYLNLTLTHSVAKINLIQSCNFESDDNYLSITLPESFSFNVSNNEISDIITDGESTPTIHTFSDIQMLSAEQCIGTSYIFAADATQSIMNVTSKLNDEQEMSISNIPFQRNYVVNIRGNYSISSSENFIVGVDDEWYESSQDGDGSLNSSDVQEVANCYMLHPADYQTYYIPVDERINDFWTNYADNVDSEDYTIDATSSSLSSEILWYDNASIQGFAVELITSEDEEFANNSGSVTAASAPNFITSSAQVAMKVTLTESFNSGNVIVAVKKGDLILWSWHLWITDYNPDAIVSANVPSQSTYSYSSDAISGAIHRYADSEDALLWGVGGIYESKFIMDRNIGAVSSEYISKYSTGSLFYQYGRKDPFPGTSAVKYESGSTYIPEYIFTQQSFVYAVNNPTAYIVPSGNWCSDSSASDPTVIWSDKDLPVDNYTIGKSIFDPSPLGWRLPINGTWSNFSTSTTTYDNDTNVGVVYSLSSALYPYTGFRTNSYSACLDDATSSIISSANLANESYFYALSIDYDNKSVDPSTLIGFTKGVVLRAIQE